MPDGDIVRGIIEEWQHTPLDDDKLNEIMIKLFSIIQLHEPPAGVMVSSS